MTSFFKSKRRAKMAIQRMRKSKQIKLMEFYFFKNEKKYLSSVILHFFSFVLASLVIDFHFNIFSFQEKEESIYKIYNTFFFIQIFPLQKRNNKQK